MKRFSSPLRRIEAVVFATLLLLSAASAIGLI